MKYASWRDGFGIPNIVGKNVQCDKEREIGVIFLIKTAQNESFGAFFDCPFEYSTAFKGSHSSFVFTLEPKEEVFFSVERNTSYLMIQKDRLVIGEGPSGPAIELDQELNKGVTSPCETFESPALASSLLGQGEKGRVEFQPVSIELFVLQ